MKILVMGGKGWLGHHIARIFAEQKFDVTILTRGKKSEFNNEVAGVKAIVADKNDAAAMQEVFQTQYSVVIDSVPTVTSLNNVHQFARNLKHYIHCSSTGGYAPLPFIPCDETAPYGGFNPTTGWSQKRIVDNLSLEYFRNEGFPATVIRPCYITGPGKLPLDNLGDRRESFIKEIIEEKPLDLPNDGQALLQPIHVVELARSFYLALEHPCSIGQIYNITLDHALPLNRYLEVTAAVFDKKPVINYLSVDAILAKYGASISENGLRFLATHMCFTNAKARRDLEFKPAYTPEEAIEETALWTAKTQKLV